MTPGGAAQAGAHTGARGPEPGFIHKYIFSVDHKIIGIQYLLTGLIMAAVGGWLAEGVRMQLAWPYQDLPGFGILDPGKYNGIITMHGTIMVFWVAMPVLLSGFGNYLLPLMIGAPDMAFPRLNRLSYWTFFASTVLLVASFFVEGGPAAAGWTAYPPLSAVSHYTGVSLGTDLWILAVALEFASMLMGGVNFLTTVINMRAKGLRMMSLPIFVWMQLSASVIFMLSVGPLIAGAVMMLLDRHAGTGFFNPTAGGDPLLWQHLFWFFGHPEVYVILLPGLGILAEVLTANARKTVFGYKMILYSIFVAGALSFIVWAHHQFVSGINPFLAAPFSLTTILISVPFAIVLFAYIATLWRGSIRFTTAMLFAVGTVAMFLVGGVTGIFLGSATSDIYFHDTYFVVAHFHFTLFPTVFLGMFAGIYFWFPKMFGRMLGEKLGKVHCVMTIAFFMLTFLPQFVLGAAGHPRRLADVVRYDALLGEYGDLTLLSTIGALGLLAAQIPFLINFVYSLIRGRRAERNPWRATTIEWLTPSPPGHGNFAGAVESLRGPYEYSVPGSDDDWLPQGRELAGSAAGS